MLQIRNIQTAAKTAVVLSLTSAVGRSTLRFMGSRKAGRAKYTPLRQFTGGAARTAAFKEKNANTDVCVFFYHADPDHGEGAVPPPWSGGGTGLLPDRSVAEWWEHTPPIDYERGKPGGEGEGQYISAGELPPDYA
jgi:hypothetical protein